MARLTAGLGWLSGGLTAVRGPHPGAAALLSGLHRHPARAGIGLLAGGYVLTLAISLEATSRNRGISIAVARSFSRRSPRHTPRVGCADDLRFLRIGCTLWFKKGTAPEDSEPEKGAADANSFLQVP